MATKTQYAKLSLIVRGEDLYAVVTPAIGAPTEKLLTPSRYPRPGWRYDKALRFSASLGWVIAEGSHNWYLNGDAEIRSLQREVELCPNGQDPEECSEVDPCESCWQDLCVEGDMIEASMGLGRD